MTRSQPGANGRLQRQTKGETVERNTKVGQVVMDPVGLVIKAPVRRSLERRITPTEYHFVLAHMGIARLRAESWELTVEGAVERPLRFTYGELQRLPSRKITTVLECAGSPLRPDRPVRRVGNAVWRGVSLPMLLRQAGVQPNAKYVWFEGEDFGTYANVCNDNYVKDIPVWKALDENVLVAYEMNHAPLSEEHGFPARALVPGFYGTNSVKWLSRIRLAATRPEGLFTTTLYNRQVTVDDAPVTEPVWSVQVNSLIVRPTSRAALSLGTHTLTGWAWGAEEVARVEVSHDGGKTWQKAQLDRPRSSYSWQQFRATWNAVTPGEYVLMCRAVDAAGRVQPADMALNQVHQVTVTIAEGQR